MAETLALARVSAGYGETHVLEEIDLALAPGESLSIIGRNGVGKSTLLETIMGHTTLHAGELRLRGERIDAAPPHERALGGLGYVPQEREIFPSLSVRENLVAAAANRLGNAEPWTLARTFDFLPRLAERQRNMGNQLSGGEQQMLAIGRALMTNPKLLILDEATEGLSPLLRQEIWSCLARLKREGQAILVIDKNVGALIKLADRHHIVEKGRVVWTGTSDALARDSDLQHRYLGV